jgi:hypothetical protein
VFAAEKIGNAFFLILSAHLIIMTKFAAVYCNYLFYYMVYLTFNSCNSILIGIANRCPQFEKRKQPA